MLGLCVVAVFAVTAFVGATTALALPEYADCIGKQSTGKFKDSNCTQAATTKEKGNLEKFELKKVVPGVGANEESIGNEKEPLKKVTGHGIGTLHWETENATTVECKHISWTGEIRVAFSFSTGKQVPSKELKNVVMTLTECTEAGKHCQNEGGPTGVIETTKESGGLKGPLGYIKGKGTKTPEVGQELKPTKSKGTFAQFECEGIGQVKWGMSPTGKLGDCIIGVVSGADTQSTASALLYNGINGEFGREQIPQAFEGKTTHCNLENKFGEGPWERLILVFDEELTYESPLEIHA
jgi:hypothetical protein